jgi:hypothetical protein
MFSSIAGILGQLASDTTALDTAEAAAADKGRAAVQNRNAKLKNVKKSLKATRAAVQGLCDEAPDAEHAQAIAVAAAFGVKQKPVRTKPPFGGNALGNGVVKLYVKVPGKKGTRASYEWRMSTDGGVSWTALPGTNVSSTVVQGLTPGQKVLFESRTMVKNILSAWSQSIGILVQ